MVTKRFVPFTNYIIQFSIKHYHAHTCFFRRPAKLPNLVGIPYLTQTRRPLPFMIQWFLLIHYAIVNFHHIMICVSYFFHTLLQDVSHPMPPPMPVQLSFVLVHTTYIYILPIQCCSTYVSFPFIDPRLQMIPPT